MNKNILKIYERATDSEVEAGLTWFDEARSFCESLAVKYSLSIEKVAAVTSILSPSVRWEYNQRDAANLIEGWSNGDTENITVMTYGFNKNKAVNLLNSDTCEFKVSKGIFKTLCFFDNIINPNSERVTIDRHAVQVYLGAVKPKNRTIVGKRYLTIEKSYVKTAKALDIKPYQLQAITWVAYKRIVNR